MRDIFVRRATESGKWGPEFDTKGSVWRLFLKYPKIALHRPHMKITRLQVHILRAPDTARPHWVSHFIVPKANEILVRVLTDEGVEGIGLATSYTPIEAAIHAVKTGIADLIVGADALAPEALYQKLFALTWQRPAHEKGWSREAIVRISAAVDIALWDIVGKRAGLPLYRLFGGYRNVVPCYVTCAYYRDGKTLSELRDEMQMLKAQGHTGFKAKAGGLPLAQDMERLELVRETIGEDRDLMVDVNRGWDLATAIEGARLLEPLNPRWLEEPVRWADDRRELKLLAQKTRIPLSAGESELTSYGCRALLEEQAIQILQFDCTMMGCASSPTCRPRRTMIVSSTPTSSRRPPRASSSSPSPTRSATRFRRSCSRTRRRSPRVC